MHDVMPNGTRDIRASAPNTVGMFRAGNRRNLNSDLNRYLDIALWDRPVGKHTAVCMREKSVYDYAHELRRTPRKALGKFWASVPKGMRSKVDRMTDRAYLLATAERHSVDMYARPNGAMVFSGIELSRVVVAFDSCGNIVKAQTDNWVNGRRVGRSTVIGRNRAVQIAEFIAHIDSK